ncbi:transcription factor Adf-1-like [Ornithodoros turicata]|uniref:transcription factor Adf-1-like n=1 Tax=Ornithodoros turicata TaxID=34597 RepID=UPI00313878CF
MAPDSVEAFIASIKKYPILYDCKRLGYRDVERKREIWEIIKKETHMESVDDCQRLWKSLRDRYIRELRALEHLSHLPWDARQSKWTYFQSLDFYRDCGRAARGKQLAADTSSTVSENGDYEHQQASAAPVVSSPEDYAPLRLTLSPEAHRDPPPPQIRPPPPAPTPSVVAAPTTQVVPADSFEAEVLSILNRPLDEDEYFALSLVPSLRRLSNRKKMLAKVKILQDLSYVEFGE